jgi:AraC-like DNA-binding protein
MGEKFIEQAESIVLHNISNDNFGPHKLASLLGLSASQTLRKIKAATGKSVNQYIRKLRLQKAARWIKETDLTFSEISYKAGFGSASYFSVRFKKYYGICPTEFKELNISLNELETLSTKKSFPILFSNKNRFYTLGVLIFVIIGFLIIYDLTSSDELINTVDVVSPLKKLSSENIPLFTDSLSDTFLHALSQLKKILSNVFHIISQL